MTMTCTFPSRARSVAAFQAGTQTAVNTTDGRGRRPSGRNCTPGLLTGSRPPSSGRTPRLITAICKLVITQYFAHTEQSVRVERWPASTASKTRALIVSLWDGRVAVLELDAPGPHLTLRSTGRDLSDAVQQLRLQLEPIGRIPVCNGARTDCYPSGMVGNMAGGAVTGRAAAYACSYDTMAATTATPTTTRAVVTLISRSGTGLASTVGSGQDEYQARTSHSRLTDWRDGTGFRRLCRADADLRLRIPEHRQDASR